MANAILRLENERFEGSGGVSHGNRALGFAPAFYEGHSGEAVPSCFANGTPAPIHILEGLPEAWVVARDATGRVITVKPSVIAGFYEERFYTREETARIAGTRP
jgi:hypothetical protein